MNSIKIVQPDGASLKIIAAQCCINAVLICSFLLDELFHFQPDSLNYFVCLFLVVLTLWSFWSWQRLTKSLFDPYTLFLLAAILFNGGQAILEVFHLNEDGILNGEFSSETILKTLFLVILGLTSFHSGALLSAAIGNKEISQPTSEKEVALATIQDSCRKVGWGLLAISFFPAILTVKDAIIVAVNSGYAGLYQRDEPTSFDATPKILADFLIPAALFLTAGSKGRRKNNLVSAIAVTSHALSQFFLGHRNVAVMPLLAFAWAWHYIIWPLPKIFLLSVGSLLVCIIFPLVAATRNAASEDRLSISFLVDTFSSIDNPIIASISEMGGSMMTVAHTVELVPRFHDFQMGVGYFYALLTLMPNFFWKVHPSVARGRAADWLVWEVDPSWASLGGGLGFSFIAEAYLNFGWYGTPITLGVIGFFYGKLVLWALKSREPAKIATVASFVSFFLFYARGELGSNIRSLVWYCFIPYLSVYTISLLRSKKTLK